MGIEIGFDLYPCLQPNELKIWESFLAEVQTCYQDDPVSKVTDLGVVFSVGEEPILFTEGVYFRRFSSKITQEKNAEPYISKITNIARKYFKERIIFWSTYGSDDEIAPIYEWEEVYKAEKEARLRVNEKKLQTQASESNLVEDFIAHVEMEEKNQNSEVPCLDPVNVLEEEEVSQSGNADEEIER